MRIKLKLLFLLLASLFLIEFSNTVNAADTIWYVHRTSYQVKDQGVYVGTCYCYSISTASILTGAQHSWTVTQGPYNYAVQERDLLSSRDRDTCEGCRSGGSTSSPSTGDSTLASTTWNIRDFGQVNFITETKASYTAIGGGTIYGQMVGKNVLKGTWVQVSSNKKCIKSKYGSYYWGDVEFRFSKDFKSVQGSWNRCGSGKDYPVSGNR